MWKASESAVTRINQAVAAQHRIIYLMTWEEERVARTLGTVSRSVYKDDRPVILWTAARGFYAGESSLNETGDPEAALRFIAGRSEDAVYLMKDLPVFLEDDVRLSRMLRDLSVQLAARNTFVFMSHPLKKIPEPLKKDVFLIDFETADDREIFDYCKTILNETNAEKTISDDWLAACASTMRGFTLNEVRHVLLGLISGNQLGSDQALEEVYLYKAQAVLQENCLEVVPVRPSISQIGGLENLKEWVRARAGLFTREAYDAGVPKPSGVLFMGVSGCGKSLAAKAIAAAWGLQLVRLDMNLVLSGAYGAPEFAFHNACRVVERIAPLVLWIDEIENAFGYDDGPATGGNVNIFSSFLTWMQEKPELVFVAATANRIQRLPAEMMRKGRFDQLFFLDLPNERERGEIFRIHIQRNDGGDLKFFDTGVLAILTEGWSGAEIEQAVRAARVSSFAEHRRFSQNDVSQACSDMVPLSQTMREQIKALRDWSHNRATPASK